MQEFDIVICSIHQIQQFVSLAMNQPFEITVGNNRQQISGKDFMGMCTLDYSKPLHVSARCSEEDFRSFREHTANILTCA